MLPIAAQKIFQSSDPGHPHTWEAMMSPDHYGSFLDHSWCTSDSAVQPATRPGHVSIHLRISAFRPHVVPQRLDSSSCAPCNISMDLIPWMYVGSALQTWIHSRTSPAWSLDLGWKYLSKQVRAGKEGARDTERECSFPLCFQGFCPGASFSSLQKPSVTRKGWNMIMRSS